MTKIRDFNQKSDMEQWVLSHLLTFVPGAVWERAPDGRPDITVTIEGEEVDINDWVAYIAWAMERQIRREADERFAELCRLTDY